MTIDFQSEMTEDRGSNSIFQVLVKSSKNKNKLYQSRIVYTVKISFSNRGN